jgi:hypothetical protein
MKKFVLFLLLSPLLGKAQTFYVEPTEKGFEKKIAEKMSYDGYRLTESPESADYIIRTFLTGQYNAFAIKKMFHGYAIVIDNKTQAEIARTKEVGKNPSGANGMQAGQAIMAEIAKKYLPPILKPLIK